MPDIPIIEINRREYIGLRNPRFSALPVLTYPNVRSAPVLENRDFRLNLLPSG